MDRAWVMAVWCLVLVLASWLRFEDLGGRPFHADEATGARITAARMSGEGGRFDPKHYHGPALGDAAWLASVVCGEDGWKKMTKKTLRVVPAVAGVLVVFVPFFWRRRMGDLPAAVAGALLAVSPLLVYYSRMFIHEMLLVAAGGAVLACFAGDRPRFAWAGVFLGLMFAVKETFVISVLAWCFALAVTLVCQWKSWDRRWIEEEWRRHARHLVVMATAAVLVSLVFYTRLFTYPIGAWDAVRTFFVYETVAGHDKAWWWYGAWLGWPRKAAGVWWFECVVLWLALLVFLASWLPVMCRRPGSRWVRFLGFSLLFHVLIYSCFGYKTPWLMCLPWMHACVLAGFGVALLPSQAWRMVAVGISCGLVWQLGRLGEKANGRYSSDARNPYAYVPTLRDPERMEEFLNQLRPLAEQDVVVVVGTDYWPLPWYVRSFSRAGYLTSPPYDSLREMPFVLVMPDALESVSARLADTHTMRSRGLRADVPVELMVRNDVWAKWMEETP